MADLRLGSSEHRDLMCQQFVDTFRSYEARDVRWPELEADDLARVRAMPFWNEALTTERIATRRIRLMVEAERDATVREAIAIQAYEEERHAALFECLMEHYGIEVPEPAPYAPRDPEWGFMRMGYGEVFDIFFAFGLFKLAADARFFPPSLIEIFEGLIAEEARHIFFFHNWAAYTGRRLPAYVRPWFMMRRAAAVAIQALGRMHTAIRMVAGGVQDKADDFVIQAPARICGSDLSFARFAEVCLAENERWMAAFDPRLPRPDFIPAMMRLALRAARRANHRDGDGAPHSG
ncbi:MAG TPA: hypothetical protein VFB33_12940 [Candidatus Binataceae bacterium]|nr:hypothetical protein [Candidatus Binataceae bacterium]